MVRTVALQGSFPACRMAMNYYLTVNTTLEIWAYKPSEHNIKITDVKGPTKQDVMLKRKLNVDIGNIEPGYKVRRRPINTFSNMCNAIVTHFSREGLALQLIFLAWPRLSRKEPGLL